MGFSTLSFLCIGLPLSIVCSLLFHFWPSTKAANIFLILLSLAFYWMGGADTFLFVLLYCTAVWLIGTLVLRFHKTLILGSAILLLVLAWFKYMQWISAELHLSLDFSGMAVPLGISFLSFSALSYIIDIHKGAPAGSLLDTFLYLLFFPKLMSGPIVQWRNFAPYTTSRIITPTDIEYGLNRISIGIAKKVILADFFGTQISLMQASIAAGAAGDVPTFWLIAILYFFQIYFDFSGYSDTAIGLCRLFGFPTPENFNYPYTSKSVTEFWRRWHISLGAWFRQYVYFPLGGSRTGNVYFNLFVIFVLTGIWHGANWTFMLWGVLNGLAVVLERTGKLDKLPAFLRWAMTMVFLFFSWILFMSPDIRSSFQFATCMFTGSVTEGFTFTWRYYATPRILFLLAVAVLASFLGSLPFVKARPLPRTAKNLFFLLLLALSLICVVNAGYTPNLYFQF